MNILISLLNPVSNLFVKNVHSVWKEVSRVLNNRGILIAGFTNPLLWIFDAEEFLSRYCEIEFQKQVTCIIKRIQHLFMVLDSLSTMQLWGVYLHFLHFSSVVKFHI